MTLVGSEVEPHPGPPEILHKDVALKRVGDVSRHGGACL
jgi:hypothetical protein